MVRIATRTERDPMPGSTVERITKEVAKAEFPKATAISDKYEYQLLRYTTRESNVSILIRVRCDLRWRLVGKRWTYVCSTSHCWERALSNRKGYRCRVHYNAAECPEQCAALKKQREHDNKYKKTKKGRCHIRKCDNKYKKTEKGRSRNRKCDNKYKMTDKGKMTRGQWFRYKCNTDPKFYLRVLLRGRLYTALKESGTRKVERTHELLGCTYTEFRARVSSLFRKGMGWRNFGLRRVPKGARYVVLDHIFACARFDLSIKAHRMVCFYFLNLQPLWDKENGRKSDKMPVYIDNVEIIRMWNALFDAPNPPRGYRIVEKAGWVIPMDINEAIASGDWPPDYDD